jgi:hypothetical protein
MAADGDDAAMGKVNQHPSNLVSWLPHGKPC